jgi:hypothetical protein
MQRYIGQFLKTPAGLILAAMILTAIAVVAFHPGKARAEGLPSTAKPFDAIVPKAAPFSGCGPTVRAGWTIGTVDTPSTVTIGSEGGLLGVGLGCDWQPSRYFLLGAFVTYDWAFNDLKTIGVQNNLRVGARIGLPVKNWMPYVGTAWSRLTVGNGIGDVDGYDLFAGLEVRLATEAPLFLALEADRGFYSNVAGSGMDVNATALTANLKYKFGGGK